jgi:hypothetical protein
MSESITITDAENAENAESITITDAEKARRTGEPRALLRNKIYNKLISEVKNMETMEDIQANIDDEVQDILGQKDIDRSPLRSLHPPNPMWIENAAADNEVQGILRQKNIDDQSHLRRSHLRPVYPLRRSPLHSVHPYNPVKPITMGWSQNAVDDDEVKRILSSRQSRRQSGRQSRRKVGGCTDRQKGIAAQIRTFTNNELREELNKIVHSGDSISAKTHHPSNEYIDLSNNFDSKAEDVLKKGIDFIKDNDKLGYKHKKKILNGIIQQLNSTTNATTMDNKPMTTLSRVTPRKTFKDITTRKTRMTPNATVKSRRNQRSRSRSRNRRNRSRSRRSRR